jgi:hypothetical protein
MNQAIEYIIEYSPDLVVNILGNIITLAIFISIGGMLYRFRKIGKLRKFFGVKNSKSIRIFLSTIIVEMGGSSGIDKIKRSFAGDTVARNELEVAWKIQSLFRNPIPSIDNLPNFLSKILLVDTDAHIISGPFNEQEFESDSTSIVIGSPGYNPAAKYLQKSYKTFCRFIMDEIPKSRSGDVKKPVKTKLDTSNITLGPGGTASPIIVPPEYITDTGMVSFANKMGNGRVAIEFPHREKITDPSFGFIERIYDGERKRAIFYLAGLSDISSAGAVYYLCVRWEELLRKYGELTRFQVLIKCESIDYTSCIRIDELSMS